MRRIQRYSLEQRQEHSPPDDIPSEKIGSLPESGEEPTLIQETSDSNRKTTRSTFGAVTSWFQVRQEKIGVNHPLGDSLRGIQMFSLTAYKRQLTVIYYILLLFAILVGLRFAFYPYIQPVLVAPKLFTQAMVSLPEVELSLAGPIIRDQVSDGFLILLNMTLLPETEVWSEKLPIRRIRIQYENEAGEVQEAINPIIMNQNIEAYVQQIGVMLPSILEGQEIKISLLYNKIETHLIVYLQNLPSLEIRHPQPDERATIDAEGILMIVVDGSVSEGDYTYVWTITAIADNEGNAEAFLTDTKGVLRLPLTSKQPCINYIISLVADSHANQLSWSQSGQACRQP